MSGPARAGLFLYAKDMHQLAAFYEAVLGMRRVQPSEDLIVLTSQDVQLIVHAIPSAIAESIIISIPPERREDTAMKFFLTLQSLDHVVMFVPATVAKSRIGGYLLWRKPVCCWSAPGPSCIVDHWGWATEKPYAKCWIPSATFWA